MPNKWLSVSGVNHYLYPISYLCTHYALLFCFTCNNASWRSLTRSCYWNRCVLLGVSCGANIVSYVALRFVEASKLLDPVKVVAQILMYPIFIGTVPTKSEIKLANSYFYDKAMCLLAWKLFLPEEEVNLNHPAANPLILGRGPPLKCMPLTLTVGVWCELVCG